MAALTGARFLVAMAPFERWRRSLGFEVGTPASAGRGPAASEARRLASQVERAAARMPFSTKCLPRAMALSWLLRRKGIGHTVVFAIRPPDLRNSPDALHAWVEVAGAKVLGDIPGPWLETLRLGTKKSFETTST